MKIDLFEHNRLAYESAIAMMNQRGKAAIIHPTGTGKSLMAFELALDNPDVSICWLAPSTYIYHTQLENLQRATESLEPESLENIIFVSEYDSFRNRFHFLRMRGIMSGGREARLWPLPRLTPCICRGSPECGWNFCMS